MKNFLSIRTLLSAITGLLVVMLVSIFAISANDAFNRKREATRTLSIVNVTRNILSAKENIRIEGGVAHAALAAPERASAEVIARMFKLRFKTDTALMSMADQFRTQLANGTSSSLADVLQSKARYDRLSSRRSPPYGCPGRNVRQSRWRTGERRPTSLRPRLTGYPTSFPATGTMPTRSSAT